MSGFAFHTSRPRNRTLALTQGLFSRKSLFTHDLPSLLQAGAPFAALWEIAPHIQPIGSLPSDVADRKPISEKINTIQASLFCHALMLLCPLLTSHMRSRIMSRENHLTMCPAGVARHKMRLDERMIKHARCPQVGFGHKHCLPQTFASRV